MRRSIGYRFQTDFDGDGDSNCQHGDEGEWTVEYCPAVGETEFGEHVNAKFS